MGGDVKLQFLVKPNLTHNLGFTMYTRVYYIITLSEVLTYNETTVPEFCHNVPEALVNLVKDRVSERCSIILRTSIECEEQ